MEHSHESRGEKRRGVVLNVFAPPMLFNRTAINGYVRLSHRGYTCLLKEDLLSRLDRSGAPALISQSLDARGAALKEGSHKSLWALSLSLPQGERPCFLKAYAVRGWKKKALSLFRRSHAIRETEQACMAREKGIPTVVPFLAAERRTFGITKESFLVTESLPSSQDLHVYLLEGAPSRKKAESFRKKQRVATELGRLCRQIHERGIFQSDFALNNFRLKVGEDEDFTFYLMDFERVRVAKRISLDRRLWMLAKMNRVGREVSAPLRIRFLKGYVEGKETEPSRVRDLARQIHDETIKVLNRDALRGRITNIYLPEFYDRLQEEEGSGYGRREYRPSDILKLITRLDDAPSGAASLPIGGEAEAEIPTRSGLRRVRIRRYAHSPLNSESARTAREMWTLIATLKMGGLPIPLPHVLLERVGRDGFLITPMEEGFFPLRQFLDQNVTALHQSSSVTRVLKRVRRLMASLHRFGSFGGKWQGNEISVSQGESDPSVFLKRVDNFRIKRRVEPADAASDLQAVRTWLEEGGKITVDGF
jgi:tRNA A-37 threonylcarbamoyl transferase component Bud32